MVAAPLYPVRLGDCRNNLVSGIQKRFQRRDSEIRGSEKDDPQGLTSDPPSPSDKDGIWRVSALRMTHK